MKHFSLCLLLLALLAGCSTVSSRIKKHPGTYSALSASDQELVALGKIREGFNSDTVYLAWGKPDDVVRGSAKGKAYETWVYLATDQQQISNFPILPIRGRGYGRYDCYPFYEPLYVTRTYAYRSVTFQNGRVTEWSDRGFR
jgi:hypothetical protein